MDWGNAIIRSKIVSPSGIIESVTADLHLEGDFRKTEKKITWLADHSISSSFSLPLVDVTLLDYDYLITKKKLEEEDNVEEFVTPVTEFRVEALADNNVKGLQVGDIIQFERKGYYRVDAIRPDDGAPHFDFIHIPDGKAAGVASKSATSGAPVSETKAAAKRNNANGLKISAEIGMYEVSCVYGHQTLNPSADTKMYQVPSIYDNSSS